MKNKIESWPYFTQKEANGVRNVILSNKVNYWTGNECREFERAFAKWTGSKYAIALSNGTVALEASINSLNLKKNDEIIVTPRSFIASASTVLKLGMKPVFADVDLNTGNITAKTIQKKITVKTRAVICVHLAGLPCEMDEIIAVSKKNNLYVIEDCSQAHGAKYKSKSVGSIGHIGTWSFCQDKIITTGGEGGMITTNNKVFYNHINSYKDHGKNFSKIKSYKPGYSFKFVHDSVGTNLRMTEMQAKIGNLQLQKMFQWNIKRENNAKKIINIFKKYPEYFNIPIIPKYSKHAWYKLYIQINYSKKKLVSKKNLIIKHLNTEGVPCFTGSCPEIYLEKAFIQNNIKLKKRLPNASILGETSLVFLVHPTLTTKSMKYICSKIDKIISSYIR